MRLFRRASIFSLVIFLSLLPACFSPPSLSYFPTRPAPGPSLLALTSGKIVVEDGCLRLEWDGGSDLLIWPYGFSYRISGNDIQILNEKGEIVARTGDYKQLGGGEVPSLELATGSTPSVNCPGPYWVVSSVNNLHPWHFGAWPLLLAILVAALMVVAFVVWLIIRRRKTNT
jgi:hypothetical protein